jgi:hypothetical protein
MGCCGWKRSDRQPDPLPAPPPHAAALERHRSQAEAALVAATGGGSLCRTGDGPEVTGPKFAEGRLAAVADLQRRARATAGTDVEDLAREALASWEAEQRTSAVRSPAWSAYREGGIAELTSVVEDLGAMAAPAGS